MIRSNLLFGENAISALDSRSSIVGIVIAQLSNIREIYYSCALDNSR